MKKNTIKRANLFVMASLWLFAISLTALVLILMNIRGPLLAP
jgi:hypothetical protein